MWRRLLIRTRGNSATRTEDRDHPQLPNWVISDWVRCAMTCPWPPLAGALSAPPGRDGHPHSRRAPAEWLRSAILNRLRRPAFPATTQSTGTRCEQTRLMCRLRLLCRGERAPTMLMVLLALICSAAASPREDGAREQRALQLESPSSTPDWPGETPSHAAWRTHAARSITWNHTHAGR